MSETSTSHTQWIQHAIAAAKAGNPSIAKIQLQKAAEEAPSDPAVWLWMGWLADSPASAAQCLELARSDKRFEKTAVAGIEFAKALAEFQIDQLVENVEANDDVAIPDVAEQDGMTLDPVEAVEEVVAAVESLQQEDTTELEVADTEDVVTEIVAEEPAKPTSDPDIDCGEGPTESMAVDESQTLPNESIADKSSDDDSDVTETVAEQPTESLTGNNVEAELMESATELWQFADKMTAEAELLSEEATQESQTDQKLWHPASDEASPTPVSDVSDQDDSANKEKTAPIAEPMSETIADESEDDFAFATDGDDELGTAIPSHVEPSQVDRNSEPAQNESDQWLGQEPAETPQAPVWRKAQSDWFSVDVPSEPEQELAQLTRPANPATATPVEAPTTEIVGADSPLEIKPKIVVPRVTASDVWQTAAVEKSAMIAAPVAQPPTYQPPVAPNSAQIDSEAGSPTGSIPQSPPVASMSDSSVFTADDSSTDRPSVGNPANAKTLDQKTVLVVDDSPTVRKLVAITLEKRGYKVVSAFDGVAAIKEIAAHNPSLILMDVNMPRLDGYQLCKLVKKHETTCNIPVLMLTGKDGMFDRLRGRLVGCAGSIAKPFSPEELLEVVEQNIAHVN